VQIFFAGVESPTHLNLLKACGVERVAVSINNLSRHTKAYADWANKHRLGGLDWICYADSPTCPVEPALQLLGGADVQCEWIAGPEKWATDTWLKDSDHGFLPIWDGHDASVLRTYAEDYEGVVLPDSVVDNSTAVRTARAALPSMGTLAGLTGRTKGVERFDVLISSAWWAVQKHGETQVWTGNRLVRLNSEDKHLKRQRYADAIAALGCDVSAVLADDPTETVRCAVLSWMKLEQHVNSLGKHPVVTNHPSQQAPASVTPLRGVASPVAPSRQQAPTRVGLGHLPILATETITSTTTDDDGNEVTEQHDTIAVTGNSSRQCSTCQLSAACPAFMPGSSCSYQIPVVIRTKDQRQAVMRALMEIQTQRILMGTFSEQVLGTHDNQVGKEMDRLMSMIEKAKAIEENVPKFHLRVDGAGDGAAASMGVISRLFGEQAGVNARLLDRPMLTDELIEEAEMIDE
jgi:hypothetical protein